MARTAHEAIIIVLDVGPNVGQLLPNGETFLSNAQLCATQILQRKILAGSKDEIGLILLGSEQTNNPLADGEGSYNNIEIAHTLQLADWQMVKTISNYEKCTTSNGDWLDALIVAADYMRSAIEGKRFKEKKIVLLSNCCADVSDDEVDSVIQGLQTEEIQIISIGPQVYTTQSQGPSSQDNKSEAQAEGEKLITRIIEQVDNSVICSFEDAIAQLMYFEQKKTRPTPWKVVMDIGSTIRIPLVGYKKVAPVKPHNMRDIITSYNKSARESAAVKSKQEPTSDGISSLQSLDISRIHPDQIETQDDEFMDSDDDEVKIEKDRIYRTVGDDAAPIPDADVIEGYMFGTTIVPVTEDDIPGLTYYSGEKCLSVLGFTKKQNVPMYLHTGDGCHQFFPEKEENCIRAFSALVQAMDSKDMVAIVRKVYRKDSTPTMCALFPMISPVFQCFVCIELPFSEDVKTLLFPPLVGEKNKPSKEQLDAVDNLITSMDLMATEYEEDAETGLFDPHKTLDPYEQHFHSIIAKKALNKDMYFSGVEVDEAVRLLLSSSEEVLESAKPCLDEIKKLFTLTEIVPKEGARKAAADIFQQNKLDDSTPTPTPSSLCHPDSSNVTAHIGTVHPQEDFKNLVDAGIPLEKACDLMAQVIRDLVFKAFDADDFNKPFKCLISLRKACLEKSPVIFNDWISKFKNELPPEKVGFWELIASGKAGLITSSETIISNISDEAAKQFLQVDDVKDETFPNQPVDEDLDDLIDQM